MDMNEHSSATQAPRAESVETGIPGSGDPGALPGLVNAPQTMRALTYSKFGQPSDAYEFTNVAIPEIQRPDELLIRVQAVGLNPLDLRMGGGLLGWADKMTFPRTLGHDAAGTVLTVGRGVKHLRPGDEVLTSVHHRHRGTFANYCVSSADCSVLRPVCLSPVEAAALPLVGTTAVQALDLANGMLRGGLTGKIVFIPGILGTVGGLAAQIAKRVYGAKEVIGTISTRHLLKLPMAPDARQPHQGNDDGAQGLTNIAVGHLEPGVVDKVYDRNANLANEVGKGKVDFVFDTVGETYSFLPLLNRGGLIVSICPKGSLCPSGKEMQKMELEPLQGALWAMSLMDWFNMAWVWLRSLGRARYRFMNFEPSGKDLETLVRWVEEGKVRPPVVGRIRRFADEDGVIEGCQGIWEGKGKAGKFVVSME